MITMKRILKTMLFVLILMISMVSCNKEELFTEPDAVVVDEKPTDDEEPNTDDDDDDVTDTTLPCDFTLDNVQPNSTIVINCILDLDGQTVSLPANVTIEYEGGDIINGTINFSEGNVIDGNLLNSTLTIGGSKPQLKDPVFDFDPKRWGIVEGETTSEIAQRNNNILEESMILVKDLGITTFRIDEMDAYFEVSKVTSTTTNQNFYPSQEAINVPSDFTLEMTDNTHLRVLPNSRKVYCLLGIRGEKNVVVKGGILHGDRDRHDDNSQEGPHAFGMLVIIHGSENVLVDGVTMINAIGDGLDVNSIGFTFEPDYQPANNIRVANCTFDNNRRNNLSITDGFNMIIENNLFLNAGRDNPNSIGMAPGFAIDVEAFRGKENGEFIYYEKAYDIIIRNNTERGSKYGAFVVAIGDDVTIENNTTEGGITIGAASGVKIIGNKLTFNPDNPSSDAGITTGHPASETTFNNEVSNNTVKGYSVGVAAYQRDTKIFGNTFEDFSVGIQPKNIKNFEIYNNNFTSSRSTSVAIFGNLTTMENVNIHDNDVISVVRESVKLVAVNEDASASNYRVNVESNNLSNGSVFSRSKGVDFVKNTTKEGLIFVNASNMTVTENNIESTNQDGIIISSGCSNLNVRNNTITVTGANTDCISNDGGANIVVGDNSCN